MNFDTILGTYFKEFLFQNVKYSVVILQTLKLAFQNIYRILILVTDNS